MTSRSNGMYLTDDSARRDAQAAVCLRSTLRTWLFLLFVAGTLFSNCFRSSAAEAGSAFLWQIGAPDGGDKEFALAPDQYANFHDDGFFVVGQSDPGKDWPYCQPGPSDAWAGGRTHTFAVIFGIASPPTAGSCKLRVKFVDTHGRAAPELKISLNGHDQRYQTPLGAGDESIFGQPGKGKAHQLELSFPANALKTGMNELTITTLSGSWVLYDWVGFEAPAGARLTEVSGTTLGTISSPPVLVERQGKLMQILEVPIRHFGPETPGTLRIGGVVATNLPLSSGSQRFTIATAAVQKPTTLSVGLEVSGRTAGTQSVSLKPVRKWIVYLLPHSHVDIGYTHVQTEVEHAQWRYIEMGIEAARKSADYPPGSRFKWNTEVLWAVDSYLKQATPEKQREFFAAVRRGWVGLDALYGNELTGLCRPEELLRLVGFAGTVSKRSRVPIESAMITDVPGYTWGMVPVFAQAGVKYFSIGPNGGDRIGHTIAAWGDKPFWWIGPNGKDRVLVWMTGTGYYRVFQSAQALENYLAGLEAKGYPYDMVQVRHCLGDNGAPDVNFADTVKKWNSTYAYPKLVIATTAQMFHDFEQRYGDQIPVAKGDFTPYWEDGAASSARETALNRASADRLSQAEALYAMLNPKAYPAADFYGAWREVILYDEHTWGAHNSISQPDAPFVKSQWAIKQAFALRGDKCSRELLQAALGQQGRGGTVIKTKDATKGTGEMIEVYNTTGFERAHELVIVPKELSSAGDGVVEPDSDGRSVRAQRLSSGELVFVADRILPFSGKRYLVAGAGAVALPNPSKGGAIAEGNVLKTSLLTVQVNESSGAIDSIRRSGIKEELVDRGGPTLVNDYFYLPGSDLKGLKRNGPVRITVKENGPVVASLLIESDAPGCRKLTREIRVVEGQEWFEIINTVNKEPVRAKEGVHFGFGFNVPGAGVSMDVPWAVVRPEVDQIPGACKNWFTVQRWVDIANKDYGVTWATPDAPLVEVGAITANLIGSLSDPKVWMDHIQPSKRIYSWAMNNHWHTNYRAEQEGPTVFRYYIWPHKAAGPAENSRFGITVAQPLLVVRAHGERAAAPRLSVSPSGVLVSTLKPSEDGRALIVRLFGASGKTEQAKLTWSAPVPQTVWISNESEAPIQKCGSRIEVSGYGLVTLRAELP